MIFILRIIRRVTITVRNTYMRLLCENISIGKGLNYRLNFRINCEKEGRLTIGNNVFFNNDCSINVHQEIVIGDACIFGEGVKIYDHNHVFSNKNIPIQDQGFISKPIKIGINCWIGSNVVILPGSSIGNNCVIGAGTIISGVIPPDCIVKHNRELVLSPIEYR